MLYTIYCILHFQLGGLRHAHAEGGGDVEDAEEGSALTILYHNIQYCYNILYYTTLYDYSIGYSII
jgi:hypothetical protein